MTTETAASTTETDKLVRDVASMKLAAQTGKHAVEHRAQVVMIE